MATASPLFPEISRPESIPWTDWVDSLDEIAPSPSWQDWSQPLVSYGYGSSPSLGISYDPLRYGGEYDPQSSVFSSYRQIAYELDKLSSFDPNQEYGTYSYNQGAVGNPTDPDWSNVNAWNNDVLAAVQQVYQETGVYVPPNVVKSIIKIESNGQFNFGQGGQSPAGARGLMQVTTMTMGNYDYDRLLTDAAYGIYAGTYELALRYQDAKRINSAYDWPNVAVGYFSGHYEPTGARDEYSSDYQYLDAFHRHMNALIGAPPSGGVAAAPGTDLFAAIWQGFDVPITQEYGWTEFARNAGSYYNYGAEYTVDGQPMGHPGVDVGTAFKTPLYTPVNGTVVCGGTFFSNGEDGCSAYTSSPMGAHGGRFQIKLDNGDMLILGHMFDVVVEPGQYIQAGTLVGYSGYENGDHVHVEYRKYAPGVTSTGYLMVNPIDALGGTFSGTYGQAGSAGPAATGTANWSDFMRAAAEGMPLAGPAQAAASGSAWHTFLLKQMGVLPPDSLGPGGDNPWFIGTGNNFSSPGGMILTPQ